MILSFSFRIPVALALLTVLLFVGNKQLVAQTSQKYRLLVVVTPAAYNGLQSANVRTSINNNLISSPNVRYAKSPVLTTVELAGVVRVNYVESRDSIDPDLDSLTAWMNNTENPVRRLRWLYGADLVTMVEDNVDWQGSNGTGGIAWLSTDANYALSCLAYDAFNFIPSAAHEFGHNFACLHDTVNSPGNSPFMYGHGYIMPDGINGDVMSYPKTYQPWFSNPDSLFPSIGGLPRGTVLRCNATRLHNERITDVAAYFTTQDQATVTNRTWKANEFGDILATDSITTSGIDSLLDSSEVKLRAGKKVVINSGFYVSKKGTLTITTGSGALGKIRAGEGSYGGLKQPVAAAKTVGNFSATASVTNQSIRINVLLAAPSPIVITVVDLSGKLLVRQSFAEQGIGQHQYLLGLREKMANKVYSVKVETSQQSKHMRIFALH